MAAVDELASLNKSYIRDLVLISDPFAALFFIASICCSRCRMLS